MKTFLTLLFTIPALSFGQEITKTLDSKTFGKINATYDLTTKDGDSSFYACLTYTNVEYKYITESGGFCFFDKISADSFVSILNKMIPLAGTISALATMGTEKFTIKCGSNQNVFFYDNKDRRTYISKANAKKLSDWVQALSFH